MGDVGGTVTIMFTDLVGSTALGDRLGDDDAQALRRAHDRILLEQFERFGGRVIKNTGDGFLVSFASARQGVECGVGLQRAITAQHAEGRYRELQVRVGLHTGEPVAEGGDVHGSDVDLAARVEAEALGGQVLVSDVTRVLARQCPGVRFSPLGERMLKGFEEPVTLYEAVLTSEAAPASSLTRFVGREREIAQLREDLEEAGRGHGRIVLIGGQPGVGKTRLVSELTMQALDRGFQVLTGRAYETEGMPAYLPITDALRAHLSGLGGDELQAVLDGNAPYLARLLPELRELIEDIPEPPSLGPEGDRYQMFEAVSGLLRQVASRSPLLLFLDDLQWADSATLALMRHLVPRLGEAPLLVLGTHREAELAQGHLLSALLADIVRQRSGHRVRLEAFGRNEAASLVEAVLGACPPPHVLEAIFGAAEGNPFFTEELVRHLREQGHDLGDGTGYLGRLEIPEGVRQVIGRRLERLSLEANRLLAYSSVLGRDLSVTKVVALTERDTDSVLDLLDEALAARVLHEQGGGYAFAHPLIGEALYQGLSGPRRRRLHARVAETLEALYGTNAKPDELAELAHHSFSSLPDGDADKAIAYAKRAAEHALSQTAWEAAAKLYQMALDALDGTSTPHEAERCELLLALGDTQFKAGIVESIETYLRAAGAARTAKAPELLARAAALHPPGFWQATMDERQVPLLEETLRALEEGNSALRARALASLAAHPGFSSSLEERDSLSRKAVAMARQVDDAGALMVTLNARHGTLWRFWGADQIEEELATVTELVRLAEEAEDKENALVAHCGRLQDAMWLGDMPVVDAGIQAHDRLGQELQQWAQLHHTATLRAMRAVMHGRFEEGERLAQEALAMGQSFGHPYAPAVYAVQLYLLRMQQGRLAEMEAIFQAAVQPVARAGLAYIYVAEGHEAEARSVFEQLAADGFASIPRDANWMLTLAALAQVCVFLDDSQRAETLHGLLSPYQGYNVSIDNAIVCYGALSRYLGLLAAVLRRWDDAERHFEDALAMNARMDTPPWVAWTQQDYAAMLLKRGEPGDREKARELSEQALATARELGMKAIGDQATDIE
jgi:class 3 adenylate cyclase/tetratricopeptide (TPR) repeat protein